MSSRRRAKNPSRAFPWPSVKRVVVFPSGVRRTAPAIRRTPLGNTTTRLTEGQGNAREGFFALRLDDIPPGHRLACGGRGYSLQSRHSTDPVESLLQVPRPGFEKRRTRTA